MGLLITLLWDGNTAPSIESARHTKYDNEGDRNRAQSGKRHVSITIALLQLGRKMLEASKRPLTPPVVPTLGSARHEWEGLLVAQ